MWFPTMWHFDMCRLRRACAASFHAQADLRLYWSHIPHCWKSHVAALIADGMLMNTNMAKQAIALKIEQPSIQQVITQCQSFMGVFVCTTTYLQIDVNQSLS